MATMIIHDVQVLILPFFYLRRRVHMLNGHGGGGLVTATQTPQVCSISLILEPFNFVVSI